MEPLHPSLSQKFIHLITIVRFFALPGGPDFFHSMKKSAKNLVKINLCVFSMSRAAPPDGILTRPQC
jgi:hypothetical protein